MLLRGEVTVAAAAYLRPRLRPQLEPIAGRRYVPWTLLSLGASLCFAPHFQGRSCPCLQELCARCFPLWLWVMWHEPRHFFVLSPIERL